MRNLALQTRAKIQRSNVTPVWLLPFWRLVKGEASGDYAKAWAALPGHMPLGTTRPSIEEAAVILVDHNLS